MVLSNYRSICNMHTINGIESCVVLKYPVHRRRSRNGGTFLLDRIISAILLAMHHPSILYRNNSVHFMKCFGKFLAAFPRYGHHARARIHSIKFPEFKFPSALSSELFSCTQSFQMAKSIQHLRTGWKSQIR